MIYRIGEKNHLGPMTGCTPRTQGTALYQIILHKIVSYYDNFVRYCRWLVRYCRWLVRYCRWLPGISLILSDIVGDCRWLVLFCKGWFDIMGSTGCLGASEIFKVQTVFVWQNFFIAFLDVSPKITKKFFFGTVGASDRHSNFFFLGPVLGCHYCELKFSKSKIFCMTKNFLLHFWMFHKKIRKIFFFRPSVRLSVRRPFF